MALSPEELPSAERPLDDLPSERTVAAAVQAGAEASDLAPERTMALDETAPAPPSRRQGSLAGPSSAGVRLGPEAERFFAPTPPEGAGSGAQAGGPFDAFGGSWQPTPAAQPTEDPFAPSPSLGFTGPHGAASPEALGKPSPKRFLLPLILGALALAALVGGGIWLFSSPAPPALEVISVPEGASVFVDERRVPGTTPLTVEEGLVAGQAHDLRVEMPGYRPYVTTVTLESGLRRQIFMLSHLHMTLRVETSPEGAQVWVDGDLRGTAPLDVPGLSAGQTLEIEVEAPGRPRARQRYTVPAGEEQASLRMTIPDP